MSSRLLTVPEVADLLSVSQARVYELAKTGVLPAVRLGRAIRIDSVRLRQFIDAGGQALPGGWRREPATFE